MCLSHAPLSLVLSTDNRLIPTEIRKQATDLQKLLEFDDEGGDGTSLSPLLSVKASPTDINTLGSALTDLSLFNDRVNVKDLSCLRLNYNNNKTTTKINCSEM